MSEWQPIETAPRDGAWFVICREDDTDFYEVGRYSPGYWPKYEEVEGGLFRKSMEPIWQWTFNNFHRATHWMPLPEPPKRPTTPRRPDASNGWRTIDSAPRDGTPVDLWIVGDWAEVHFYALAVETNDQWGGRTPEWQWEVRKPNPGKWYPRGGLGVALSPEVVPTHWMPLPAPPAARVSERRRA